MLSTVKKSVLDTAGVPFPDDAEYLAMSLDQRELRVGHQQWRLTVYGIYDEAGHRWIQLGLESQGEGCLATLMLEAGHSDRHVMQTLADWLARPGDVTAIRSVA